MIVPIGKEIPAYYPTMFLDGYSPEEILYAAHKTFLENASQEDEAEDAGAASIGEVSLNVNIKGGVK